MENLNFSELNKILSSLESLRIKKNLVSSDEPTNRHYDSSENWEEVYSLDGYKDLYVKLSITENSYGTEEFISGVQFVKPTVQTVQSFETI